ncbi:helix-turn-helix domain-containing protein [Stenotrophomonas sp. Ste96]|uniref:helix-turn-helix domain-containing protein n=1 Tax=Stenotrophomonas sp. Ste96 TaxID=2926029 RepID=UPI0021C8B201|nr:helix-turn-helix domain-containing protein [Stenotrophomonas sp. Ste96]
MNDFVKSERTQASRSRLRMEQGSDDLSQIQCKRPVEGTARAAVLEALEAGQSLTQAEALREFGTLRLAADVHALRRAGWPIITTDTEVPTRRGTSRVATYHLAEGADVGTVAT